MVDSYQEEFNSPEQVYEDFDNIRQYWNKRNDFIREAREHNSAVNKVEAPVNTKYKVRIMHTGILAGIVGQKASRFMPIPQLQGVINDPLDLDERSRISKFERAINVGQYEGERMGDGDVWGRLTVDAILLDEGVERIERLQASRWPDLVAAEAAGRPMDVDKREAYKKEHGWPIRNTYVPLEFVYPRYDGSIPVEVFELEPRSVYSIKRDPMFRGRLTGKFEEKKNRTNVAVVLHHDTPKFHAYYLMEATETTFSDSAENRNDRQSIIMTSGKLTYLASYAHNLGRTQYNFVAGRYGGWKTANGGILDSGKVILQLNGVADEVASQVLTNLRATNWPTFKFLVDPDRRGQPTEGPPQAPVLQEGQDITMYVGEDMLPLVDAKENETIPWFFGYIQERINSLGGSAVLTGENSPGVRTGYHNALQVSQAESYDEKIEQHLVFGAIQRGTITLLHCREIGEKVWVHHVEEMPRSRTKVGNYLFIDPESLYPLPRLDARIRKPRPVDEVAAIRAAREATDERGGKGPLLSDDTALERYLAIEEPDTEELKKLVEKTKLQAIEAGLVLDKVREELNLAMAKSGIPELNGQTVAGSDPALQAAVQGAAPQSAQAGGINPHTLMQTAESLNTGGGAGLQPGQPVGQSQPEANAGTEINSQLAASL